MCITPEMCQARTLDCPSRFWVLLLKSRAQPQHLCLGFVLPSGTWSCKCTLEPPFRLKNPTDFLRARSLARLLCQSLPSLVAPLLLSNLSPSLSEAARSQGNYSKESCARARPRGTWGVLLLLLLGASLMMALLGSDLPSQTHPKFWGSL